MNREVKPGLGPAQCTVPGGDLSGLAWLGRAPRRPTFHAERKWILLAPALRRALADAETRAGRRRLELRREKLIEQLSYALTQAETVGGLLRLCLGPWGPASEPVARTRGWSWDPS
jgi:hypothetical protein